MIINLMSAITLFLILSFTTIDISFNDYVETEIPYLKELYMDIHKNLSLIHI